MGIKHHQKVKICSNLPLYPKGLILAPILLHVRTADMTCPQALAAAMTVAFKKRMMGT